MPFSDLILHLLNFVAPAFFVALLLALMARGMFGKAAARGFWVQAGLNFAAGVAVSAMGLWVTGRDGKMATYAALVIVCGSVQWLSSRR